MIHFSQNRWGRIKDTYNKYWSKTIDRPVLGMMIREYSPSKGKPAHTLLSQANCHDLSISPDEIVDGIEHVLSQYAFYGDAFPMFNMDCFGPGVIAAFLGAKLDNRTGKVWFSPSSPKTIPELSFQYDPDNLWLKRIKSIYLKANERFQGSVLLGMPDLGGTLDILSSFRPGENLLFDLYDEPEAVLNAIRSIDILWQKFYDELSQSIGQDKIGYTDWSTLYSTEPSYIIQSDFSYMISPEMFDVFVMPSLARHTKCLSNTLYHLDGPGELIHLDKLLAMENLKAIQWIPGDGQLPSDQYPQIYQQILEVGKQISLSWCTLEEMEHIFQQASTTTGFHRPLMAFEKSDKEYALQFLNKHKIEP